MTEVPEHLLQRSRERRQALGLATSGGDAGDATPAASPSTGVDVARAPAAAPTAAGAPPAPPATTDIPDYVAPPPPPPPRESRVPMWALPVLAALPFWAILYAGTFGDRTPVDPNDPAVMGARVYRSAGCSGCHGPSGQGGVGPSMVGVKNTFPDVAQHEAWIVSGSRPGQPYGATGKVSAGGMPPFGDSLSPEEIHAVALYERDVLDR